MIYSDGVHIVADTLAELHDFAKWKKIPKNYFHGVRKGHPHYDCPKWLKATLFLWAVKKVSSRWIVKQFWFNKICK